MRHLVPLGAVLLAMSTEIICLTYTLSNDVYIGGIPWPYMGDAGHMHHTYFIFAGGWTAAAVLLAASNAIFWRRTFGTDELRPALARATVFLGCPACGRPAGVALGAAKLMIASCVSLAIAAIVPTIEQPEVHAYATYATFILQLLALVLYAIVDNRLKDVRAGAWVSSAIRKRNVITATYVVAFLLYLPIGLSLSCEEGRLSKEDCIGREGLGADYCESIAFARDSSLTDLPDYSRCPRLNTMRSVSQFICTLMVLAFHATLSVDLRGEPDDPMQSDGDDTELEDRVMKSRLGM
jgi:hypothetical protein